MASEQEINRRLRSLHQDFDFLLDNNVISTDLYDELVQRIPRRYNASSAAKTTSPAPISPAPVVVPSSTPPPASVDTVATQVHKGSLSSEHKSPPPPPTPSQPPPAYGLAQAEALYDYNGTDEGDLNLVAGQRITVLEYVNNDWWRGEGPDGKHGIFPSNYVRKIEGPSDKEAYPPPAQYYPQYPPQPYQQPMYGQPVQYQQPQPAPVQQEEKKHSKLGDFGKQYGRTFVNATAWGGGMALGADVINKIF